MKTAVLLVGLLLSSSADDLASLKVGAVRLDVPVAWTKADEKGTLRFTSPSEEAYFQLDVGKVQRAEGLEPQACLEKIMGGIGGSWKRLSVGSAPAAVKTDVDVDEKKKEFLTYTFVGCNGKTTWAISFHTIAAKKGRFGPLAEKIANSVTYVK
jgi:hypothetical protein